MRAEGASRDVVVIHTDGACLGNPGPGGWGAVLAWRDHRRELSGGEPATTNNRMELMAAIMALEALRDQRDIELHTDSRYVQQGISEWLPNWKRRGWRTASGSAVKNADLWQRLEQATAGHRIDWRWVKGNAVDPGTERADELASEAARRVEQGEGG